MGIGAAAHLLNESNRNIESLPPQIFDPNNINQPTSDLSSEDLQNPAFPGRDEGLSDLTESQAFPGESLEEQKVEGFPNSCPADDLYKPYFSRSLPEWLKERFRLGNEFNQTQKSRYPYSELYIDNPAGDSPYRLDSYNDVTGEIVSRKFTQLADVQPRTAIKYINEIETKYAPGRTIANVPSSGSLAGRTLKGTKILEVPIQNRLVPQSVIDAANKADVIIRDTNGKIYNP